MATCVWKYSDLTQLVSLAAHLATALYTVMSPDGAVVTSGGDQTLRFWNVFSKSHSEKVSAQFNCWEKIFFN
jgi:cell division cycle 20-like protein 1 (cofactor of APC complex)